MARFSAINLIFTIHLGLASTRQVYARDVINIIIIPVVLNIICVEYFNYYALRPRGILMQSNLKKKVVCHYTHYFRAKLYHEIYTLVKCK